MRNEVRRTQCGLGKRIFTLLIALVFSLALIPSSALANSADTENAKHVTQIKTTNETPTSGDDLGNLSNTSDSSNNPKKQSNTANESPSENAPANENGVQDQNISGAVNNTRETSGNEEQKNTVNATLTISIYGTTLINHTFTITSGATVEELLNLARVQGYISAYSYGLPSKGYTSYYVNSITIDSTVYKASGSIYWASTINGQWDNTGLNETVISSDGFSYELNLTDWKNPDNSLNNGSGSYPSNPNAAHPDNSSKNDTTSFVNKDGKTSAVTSAPTNSNDAVLAWKEQYAGSFGGNYISEILTIGDSIFFASGPWGSTATLYCLDAKTGKEKGKLVLFGAVDYTCRPAYSNGIIVVPLSGGRLQGIAADSLTSLWVSMEMDDSSTYKNIQSTSPVTIVNGMAYTGISSLLNKKYDSIRGAFFGVDLATGALKWRNLDTSAGFFWAGSCHIGNALIYGNDAGILSSVDPTTGAIISTLSLGSKIRSTVTANNTGTEAFISTYDGILHKIAVSADGVLTEQSKTPLATKVTLDAIAPKSSIKTFLKSVSSATLYNGKLFVGGSAGKQYPIEGSEYAETVSKGILSIIDATSMELEKTIIVPFEIQGTPLVTTGKDGETYVYFTCNGAEGSPNYTSGGGIFVYKLGDTNASLLYNATGAESNYCTKTISLGSDGTLYWSNDSGTVFALKKDTDSKENKNNNPSSSTLSTSVSTTIAASKTPLSSQSSKETTASSQATSFHGEKAATNSSGNSADTPFWWLPYTGIAAGAVGLLAVGSFLVRLRKH